MGQDESPGWSPQAQLPRGAKLQAHIGSHRVAISTPLCLPCVGMALWLPWTAARFTRFFPTLLSGQASAQLGHSTPRTLLNPQHPPSSQQLTSLPLCLSHVQGEPTPEAPLTCPSSPFPYASTHNFLGPSDPDLHPLLPMPLHGPLPHKAVGRLHVTTGQVSLCLPRCKACSLPCFSQPQSQTLLPPSSPH